MQLQLARDLRLAEPGGAVHALAPLDGALLLWLALEGATPRARLAQLLWPDKDANAARNSLRQRLFQLRKSVGVDLVRGNATLALAEGVSHNLDDADTLLGETAGEDLAPGEFAQWLATQRERRRDRVRRGLVDRSTRAEAARDWDDALTHARELLALEPLSEDAHRRVMRLHYLAGDRSAALLAFDACERTLKDEVGAKPSTDTLALLATIERSGDPTSSVAPRHPPAGLLRPPRLIGRERELRALAEGLAAGHTVFVVGEAGMGKTRLLETLRQSQTGRWAYASARPGDASVPFASLARLLRQVAQASAAPVRLPEPSQQRELARLLPEIDALPPPGEGQRLALEQAVRAFLAAQPPLQGLLLDDLHFADRASLELLAALLSEPGDDAAPLRCALAFRPAEAGSPLVALQDALLDRLNLVTLALAPLDEPALAALIESLALPGVDAHALAPQIHRRTGGNPMFVLETLKQAVGDGLLAQAAGETRLPAPAAIGRLIERRLAQLSPSALALARVASIAGVDFELGLAEQVLGTSAMHLADAINELEAAQVLRGDVFAHDLVFETVRGGVPRAVALRTHAQVAQWIEARGGEPARLAEHWIAAEQCARAIAPLCEAGRRNALRTAYGEAQRCAERAAALARECGDTRAEFEALDEFTEYCTYEDPGKAADAAIERMATLAPDEATQLRCVIARYQLGRRRQSYPPEEELRDWLATALRLGDGDRAGTLAVIGSGMYVSLGRPEAGVALIEQHRDLLERSASGSDLASLYGNLASALANQDRFDDALALYERGMALDRKAGEKVELMRSMVNTLRCYRAQGRLETALARWQEIERWHAAEAPNPQSRSTASSGMAEALCDLERYDEALLAVEVDLEMALRAAGRLALAWPVARARIWMALGQTTRALQALAAGETERERAPGWLHSRWLLLRAQAEARLQGNALDRPGTAALDWLEQAARAAPRDHRRLSWFECELQRAAWSAPSDGAARAELVALLARQQGMLGHAQHALWRAAERHVADGRVQAACSLLDQARALMQWRFADSALPEPVFPIGLCRTEALLIELRVLEAAGDASLHERARCALAHVDRVAAHSVAPPYRDAFVHRHPVHLALRALASRVGAGALTAR